ncbi:MAG: hypothetical protein KatS3mg088_203 [Patescibacteria group bacterium]|nr:MAG: hypothetical protein KatS3mg088_203 [Patescibacteria group bacterium]
MDFKDILPKKLEQKECYWSIVIEPDWVQSGIWKVDDGKVDVVSFGAPLSWQKGHDLVEVVDSSLSVAIQNLTEDVEPSKTVFGLPPFWVENGQIKPDYQEQIKRICQELSLKPVGFVALTEAIAYYLKSQEGDFLSAIVVAIFEENLSVSLFVDGKVKGESQVARSVSLVEDLVEGISRFSFSQPLPPRIILYDGREGELEDLRQTLTTADWSQYPTLKFLHLPKIEIIRSEEKILAISLAGGVELEGANRVELVSEEGEEREKSGIERIESKAEGDNFKTVDESLDFVVGEDIKKVSEEVIGSAFDGGKEDAVLTSSVPVQSETTQAQKSFLFPLFDKVKRMFLRRREKGKNIIFSSPFGFDKKPLIIGLLSFVFFLVAGFLIWWFLPSAQVTIYVSPQKIEEKADLRLDKSLTSLDLSSKALPAKEIKKEISGEKTISVTGSKIVGDKAKGKVEIYRTGGEITLPKGTKLQSSSGLIFVLDEDTNIASGSASTPSKTEASVTAFDIGSEYNLASGESFSVGNYATSTIEAKNEEAFSGGSSREISAVSSKDYEKVLDDLKKELEEKLLADIEPSIGGNEIAVRESLKEDIKNQTYNHKVGDEADSLKLNLTLSASILVINKDDLYQIAKEILKDKTPSGYSLRQDQLKVSFSLGEENNQTYSFKVNFVANLLPKVSQEEIAKTIAGRDIEIARNYLIKDRGYDRVEITVKPNFGFRKLMVLPHIAKRIYIQFEASPSS